MKTKLILGSFLALTASINAQWTTSGSNIYNSNTGNAGIGTTAPLNKLDILTTTASDGIRITHNGTGSNRGAAGLQLNNLTSGGKNWGLFSLGTLDAAGSGNFSLYNLTSGTNCFFVSGSNSHVGIGTITPGLNKLLVTKEIFSSNGSIYNRNIGVNGYISNGSGYTNNLLIGVEGSALANDLSSANSYAIGVSGSGTDAKYNYGGAFTALANSATSGGANYGIYASVFSAGGGSDWAGYFQGNTYSTGTYQGSDIKLKKDIQPLKNALAKINLLKPSTYEYKTTDYKNMSLPEGTQMGLIAQELEEVFPGLVKETIAPLLNEKGKINPTSFSFKSVNYVNLIPVLIAGIQEQEVKIEAQQKQLDEQKQLINQLLQKSATSTGIDQNSMGAAGFKMEQNKPNPFNGITTVRYTIPNTVTNAYMAVYDLSGKQIASFPITEKGSSAITLTSEKLAAGIYIYSIVADNKIVDSKRMIVTEK
jgi:hypothetical protein